MSEDPDRAALLSDLRKLEERLDAKIDVSHEETRRHFDIMVEKVHEAVKLVAEVGAHHGTVLDEHEHRIKKIERRRPL